MPSDSEQDTRLALTPMPAATAAAVGTVEQRLQKLIDELIKADEELDLRVVPDADLESEAADLAARSRQLYVVSLLRTMRFLRRQPGDFSEEFAQAKIATSVMADAHRTQMHLLQLGRSTRDPALVQDVSKLLGEVTKLADAKARVLARKQANAPASKPPRSAPAPATP